MFALDLREREREKEKTLRGQSLVEINKENVCILPVVGHVTLNKVSCSESSHQGELPCQHGAADHAGQLASVFSWLVGAGTLDTEHLHAHTQRRFHIRELANSWLDGAAHFNVIA